MSRDIALAVAGLAILGLGWLGFEQDAEMQALRRDLDAVRTTAAQQRATASTVRSDRAALVAAEATRSARYRVSGMEPPSVPSPAGAVPTAVVPATVVPAAPRAEVSHDEIARVESAVLTLLDQGHPELREKLRAVVQEQQESLQQREQEQRRERWIGRVEGRLADLTESVGLSASQKEAIVALTLGTRDQITDLMRSAETGQDFNSARKTARQLRTETDTKIRELLSPSQYEAYKALDTDDDRSMGGGPPRSPR